MSQDYPEALIKEIIRMAMAKRVSFEEIKRKKDVTEAEVITIMRQNLKPSLFRAWRAKVSGSGAKHQKLTQFKNKPPAED
jgi:uncharacterized protein (TIGR03643 family)